MPRASSLPTTAVLDDILAANEVTDERGVVYPLHSHISRDEGRLIASIIEQNKFSRTLEVGCAYGISSLYICEALSRREAPSHTIVDPFQSSDWRGIGVSNLRRAGYDFFELIEEPSELCLPALLRERKTFDFALIDGWHTFDHTLLDFFYINRLLEEGGVVAFDDVYMSSVRRVARYVANYPNYKLIGTAGKPSRNRTAREWIFHPVSKLLPRSLAQHVFDAACLRTDTQLGINTKGMVAFQKTGPDLRSWNWYAPF